ncbi:hypothetical protein Ae201684P_015429 [Aphanomyces euteiches]|nr:hypothetical protein Ae201684P_015429 [Aphanomyces euteiches]
MNLNLSTLSIAGATALLVLFGAVLLRRSSKENPLMRLSSPNASSALFGHLFDFQSKLESNLHRSRRCSQAIGLENHRLGCIQLRFQPRSCCAHGVP